MRDDNILNDKIPLSHVSAVTEAINAQLLPLRETMLGITKNSGLVELGATVKLMEEYLRPARESALAMSSLYQDLPLNQFSTVTEAINTQLLPLRETMLGITKNSGLVELGATVELMEEYLRPARESALAMSSLYQDLPLNQFSTVTEAINAQLLPLRETMLGITKNSGLVELGATVEFMEEQLKPFLLMANDIELNKDLFVDCSFEEILEEFENTEELEEKLFEKESMVNEVSTTLSQLFPEFNQMKEALSKRQLIALCIFITWTLINVASNVTQIKSFIEPIINNDYLINRNKVRVRTEPSTETPDSIITKLNKNHYVEKIDQYKNWIKIEFEDTAGEIIEGWVRRDMLMKIEE